MLVRRAVASLILGFNITPVLAFNYAGVMVGYGDTNWNKIKTVDPAMQVSLPSGCQDSGIVYGFFLGRRVFSWLNIEARYTHFARSVISFAQYNEYNPPSYDAFSMTSRTDAVSLVAQLIIPLSQYVQIDSVFGVSYTRRSDTLASVSGIGALFGGGLAYQTGRWRQSIEFDFVTGDATVDLEPVVHYLPFLTTLQYSVAYRF